MSSIRPFSDSVMNYLSISLILCTFSTVQIILADQCVDPQVSTNSYTTQDAFILREIAYVTSFNVKCKTGDPANLYALIGNAVSPVAQVASGTYEISWTEDVKSARTGNIPVSLYDENGYAALKKALRNNEDISSVPVFTEIFVNSPGVYSGPWLSCELLAVGFSIAVVYTAIHFRTKLLN